VNEAKQILRAKYRLIRWTVTIILIAAACYRFINIGFAELQQWDEGIYAIRTLHVLEFDQVWYQWGTLLEGTYYSGHPPLYVWSSAVWVTLIGNTSAAFRLTSAIAVACSLWFLVVLLKRYSNILYAGIALAFIAFSPLITFYSRQGQLNVTLMMFMLLTLLCYEISARKRKRSLLIPAGIFLGLALMTKLLHALAIPGALFLSGLLLYRNDRGRMLTDALIMFAVSLPLWLPWMLGFAAFAGDGDAHSLFSFSMPLGNVLQGVEGSVKETGKLFYLNQLLVQFSFLFPFAVYGLINSLRNKSRQFSFFIAVFLLSYLGVLHILTSSFIVYLIPLFPAILLMAVLGMKSATKGTAKTQLVLGIAAYSSWLWGLSQPLRTTVKRSITAQFSAVEATSTELLIASILAAILSLGIIYLYLLYKQRRINSLYTIVVPAGLLLIMAITTVHKTFVVEPIAKNDGANELTKTIKELEADKIFLVSNADNPQFNYYMMRNFQMPGSPSDSLYTRLEPAKLGSLQIAGRIFGEAATKRILVVVNMDGVLSGSYTVAKVLPASHFIVMRSQGYVLAIVELKPKLREPSLDDESSTRNPYLSI
jgi:4-amino-4-deoxy-L-arabinose transferase-like glycosyltransferase